jgi:hypothetical protein
MHSIFGIFETFFPCRYGWQLSNEPLHAIFGLTVHELKRFKDFSLFSGMLSATVNAANSAQKLPKTAQNCQNLPKDETSKFHQKLRF